MRLPTKATLEKIKQTGAWKKYLEIVNSNGFVSFVCKTIASLIIWTIALIPFWIYLFARWIADPTGFWQEFAVFMVCAVIMGVFQIGFAVIACFLTIAVIATDDL